MDTQLFIKVLLSIIGFIGALGVHALIRIANSVNDIKINIKEIAMKHEALESKHDSLERRVQYLEH